RGYLEPRGDLCGVAKWELPSGRCVDDDVVARPAVPEISVPDMSRGGFEHLSRGRACYAHRLIELAHAARSVGVLISLCGIPLRLHDLNSCPVGTEFIGKYHREAGFDAGPHFRSVRNDRDETGGVDDQVDVRLKCVGGFDPGGGRTHGPRPNPDAEDET